MTWFPHRNAAAEKARFIAIYGEELWNQIQALSEPKPLAEREVMKPRRKSEPTTEQDRPALQTEGSDDPNWWDK